MKLSLFTHNKRQGMSSIVFAIAFVTILSLLSIGFATIARRDTNEVLDRTLSYQAQYAAESGVNKAIKQINNGTTAQTDCDSFTLSSDVSVTCLKWGLANDNKVVLNNINEYPKNIKLVPGGGATIESIKLEWSYDTFTIPNHSPSSNLPVDINGNSVLKIALAEVGGTTNNLMYAVASTNGISSTSLADGSVVYTLCNAGICTLDISTGVTGNWYLALSTLGEGVSNIKIQALDSASRPVDLVDIQYLIDSNAIANGVTKRLQARVPKEASSWLPGNAVTANRICKDIKIDSNNNTNISGYSYPSPPTSSLYGCPNSVSLSTPNTGNTVYINSVGGGGGGNGGGGNDASVQTPPASSTGNGVNNPEWFLWYSIGGSTINNGERASCTFELLYSRNNINPALMQVASGVRTLTGNDCNDFSQGGKYVTFKPGVDGNGSMAWQQCDNDLLISCGTPGFYNVRMYVVSNSGARVGPKYRMMANGSSWENSCRPLEVNSSGNQVCSYP